MPAVCDARQIEAARRFKSVFSRYQRNRDLISVGAYVAGADPALDAAIAAFPRMEAFLQQPMDQSSSLQDGAQWIDALLASIPTGSE
jgi:flagellum-specific ATP synthase